MRLLSLENLERLPSPERFGGIEIPARSCSCRTYSSKSSPATSTAVSVATLGAWLDLARPGDPAATRATTPDRAENQLRRMQQSSHEHAAGLGAPGRAPSTKGSSRRIRLVFARPGVRPPVALISLPMRSSGCPANGGRAYGARTCNALYTPASAMGCRGG